MEKSYLSIEEIVSLPTFSNPAVSADGNCVAYEQKVSNWEENKYQRYTMVYERIKDSKYPLTTGKTESFSPAWSPVAKQLAYLSPVGEGDDKKHQIFIRDCKESADYQLTHVKESVEKFKWAPSGKGFFFLSLEKDQGIEGRKKLYGDFEYVDKDYQYNTLSYLALEEVWSTNQLTLPQDAKKSEQAIKSLLKGQKLQINDFDISPDGKRVAFNATPSPNLEDMEHGKLYLLEVETGEVKELLEQFGAGPAIFSPDGKYLCYSLDKGWPNNNLLMVLNLETGEHTRIAEEIDENLTPKAWTERGILIEWQEKASMILGLVNAHERVQILYRAKDSLYHSASASRDGFHFVYLYASPTEPTEVYLDNIRVTDQYKHYEKRPVAKKETIRWKSQDGTEIEGVLAVPVDFDPHKQYPLAVIVHGGPVSASYAIPSEGKYYPTEQFIERGFLVLLPNYRGSAGYGEKFRKLNIRNLGIRDYEDVISGVDYLIEKGWVNPAQVGVMGWSQGGYISAFCATYSQRFKAISVGAGISNWITYYVNTDIHQFTRRYLGDNPWNDLEIYRQTSPMTYIKNASTPTLIQHGSSDNRVPLPNAYELYQGIKDQGVETELVVYKGMPHGANKPGFNLAIMKQNYLWFCHHLFGDSLEGFYLKEAKTEREK